MDNKKETYSTEEVVNFTLNILKGIVIPVEFSESIGIPVSRAIGNLKVLAQIYEKERVAAEIAAEGSEKDGRNAEAE